MSISIVITTYNLERYVQEAVYSALDTGVEEVIVVDDGSKDDTVKVANNIATSEPRVRVLSKSNGGSSHARNLGAKHATCKYIMFLDGDDRLLPGGASRLAAMLEAAPAAVCAYGQWRPIDENGRKMPSKMKLISHYDGFVLKDILIRGFVSMGASIVRREAFFLSGGFDPNVGFAEDWEFWCRMALLGDFCASKEFIMEYRIRANSKSASRLTRKAAVFATIDKVFSNIELKKHVSESELAWLKRKSRACALIGVSTRHFWEGHYKMCLRDGLNAALEYPLLTPRIAGRLILNCFMLAISRSQ